MIYTKRNFPGTYIRVNSTTMTEEKFNNLKILYPKAMIVLEREDIKNKKFLYSFNEITYRKNDFERVYLKRFTNRYNESFNFDIDINLTYKAHKVLKTKNNDFFDYKMETKKEKINSNLFVWEEIPTNLLGEIR